MSSQNPEKSSRVLPVFLLFLIGALWGGFYVLIKLGVTNGVHPFNYLFWFTVVCGLLLLAAAVLRGLSPRLQRVHWPYYLKLGFVRFTIGNAIFYSAQGKLPVGLMAVIMTFVPIFTYSISLGVRIEVFRWLRATGIILGFIGVLLIVVPRSSLPDPSMATWVIIGLGAPLMHAVSYVALSEKTRPAGVDSMILSSGTLLAAALIWCRRQTEPKTVVSFACEAAVAFFLVAGWQQCIFASRIVPRVAHCTQLARA